MEKVRVIIQRHKKSHLPNVIFLSAIDNQDELYAGVHAEFDDVFDVPGVKQDFFGIQYRDRLFFRKIVLAKQVYGRKVVSDIGIKKVPDFHADGHFFVFYPGVKLVFVGQGVSHFL